MRGVRYPVGSDPGPEQKGEYRVFVRHMPSLFSRRLGGGGKPVLRCVGNQFSHPGHQSGAPGGRQRDRPLPGGGASSAGRRPLSLPSHSPSPGRTGSKGPAAGGGRGAEAGGCLLDRGANRQMGAAPPPHPRDGGG